MSIANEFFLALDQCCGEAVKASVRLTGISLDVRDPDGRTLLMLAVLRDPCCHEALEALLKLGADPNESESKGQRWTALHFASKDCNKKAVVALLAAGADVNARNSLGNAALHYAAGHPKFDQELLACFLKAGADVGIKNNFGVPVSLLIDECSFPIV